MAKFIVGKKLKMVSIFDEAGTSHPVTVIHAPPITVTQVKNTEKDGYDSVQVGFGEKKENKVSKPQKGHAKTHGNFAGFKEFKSTEALALGAKISVTDFNKGDIVVVSGISKGKGFQGVVKRHGFGGGRRTHGQKHSEREPGTIGGGLRTRVPKGMRMAGRMGGERVTVKNLKVIQVNGEANTMSLEGAVPGRRGSVIEIRSL